MLTRKKNLLTSLPMLFVLLVLLSGCGQEQAAVEVATEEPTWQELYDSGVEAFDSENYDEAIEAFEAAIALEPDHAEAYEALADVYLAMENVEKSIETLQQGYDATGDESLAARLAELSGPAKPEYLTDYLGMTVNELAETWGEDYSVLDGLYLGGSKGLYYQDDRIPVIFYFDDPLDQGVQSGDEKINMIATSTYDGMVSENLPCDTTYSQLVATGLDGVFTEFEDSDVSATYIFQIRDDISVT